MPKEKRKGSKEKIREFLLANLGRVLSWQEIREAAGGVEQWSRRLRELRDEEGYQILSHRDRSELRPGQYLIETDKQLPAFSREISAATRAYVLERNGYTCQMCGLAAGDPDPYGGPRKVRLHIGHIIDKSKGGTDDPSNLRAVCTTCNEGLQNAGPQKPDLVLLMTQIRRATRDDQLHVLAWLKTKFGESDQEHKDGQAHA